MNRKYLGVFSILLASVMWAIEPVFAKLSYQTADFLQTSAIRAIFAALTGLIYIILTKKAHFRINKQQFSTLVYIAIVGVLFADLMYFFALTQISVINAVIIGHMQPIFIILIGFLALKQDKLTIFDYIGILFMLLSGALVTTKTLENLLMLNLGSFGDLLVLSATIAWATTAIAMRKYLREMHAGLITVYRFFFAALFFVIYLMVTSSISISNIYQVVIGVVAGVGTILYYEGLKRIKAAQVSGIELSTPFFAAILGFFILGETVTAMQIVGIFLLFVGIYCLSKREDKN
ncbi:MAG: DMT family transporter [Candidatus Thermoplasmatota archaeon]